MSCQRKYSVGNIIMAKCVGQPIWPAKILALFQSSTYRVKFYNQQSQALVQDKHIYEIQDQTIQNAQKSKDKAFRIAMKEALEEMRQIQLKNIEKVQREAGKKKLKQDKNIKSDRRIIQEQPEFLKGKQSKLHTKVQSLQKLKTQKTPKQKNNFPKSDILVNFSQTNEVSLKREKVSKLHKNNQKIAQQQSYAMQQKQSEEVICQLKDSEHQSSAIFKIVLQQSKYKLLDQLQHALDKLLNSILQYQLIGYIRINPKHPRKKQHQLPQQSIIRILSLKMLNLSDLLYTNLLNKIIQLIKSSLMMKIKDKLVGEVIRMLCKQVRQFRHMLENVSKGEFTQIVKQELRKKFECLEIVQNLYMKNYKKSQFRKQIHQF